MLVALGSGAAGVVQQPQMHAIGPADLARFSVLGFHTERDSCSALSCLLFRERTRDLDDGERKTSASTALVGGRALHAEI
jgi:hypothetical protein